ncbi:MAG: hypothetical protein MI867_14895 [Pseudomonadales bacterium]|nr:hypothetical protein [Pseudomonadales bacterium]
MEESAVKFGKSVKLVGVVTKPDNVSDGTTAMILFNSGVRHHVGCCRMSVRMARAVAEQGIPSLRFDLSGVGDSPLRNDGMQYQESSIEEAKQAMDYLSRTMGIEKFVLYGLCSGAHLGFKLAQQDPRIVGLIQVDGYLYRTTKFYIRHYLPRLFDLGVWTRILFNRIPQKLGLKKAETKGADLVEGSEVEVQEWPDTPPRQEVQSGYEVLINRGVKQFSYVTGDRAHDYNYEKQFFDMFPGLDFKGTMGLSFMPEASHILTEKQSQLSVLKNTTEWLKANF